MANGFDPVGAFQGGRRNALAIQAAEQDIDRQPFRNQLQDLQLQQAQTGLAGTQAAQTRTGTEFDQQQALQRATVLGQSAQALLGLDPTQRPQALQAIAPQLQKFGIDAAQFSPDQLTDQNLQSALAESQAFVGSGGDVNTFAGLIEGFTPAEQEQAKKIRAGLAPKAAATVQTPEAPQALLAGLGPDVAPRAAAAFKAAGGGKDGVKALAAEVDKGSEVERRQAAPEIIRNNFPTASPAELQQLQATMDAAKTTESGLKAADKVRVEQRKNKKAQVFQNKAVELLTGILANPQLGDVLGSIEGNIDTRLFSDAEAELIADIQEAGNILTADNLSLMSGVLSETDIKILQNLSGGALNRTRTEKRFINDVTELRDRLSASAVTTIDDQQPPVSDIEQKRARLEELRAKAGQ